MSAIAILALASIGFVRLPLSRRRSQRMNGDRALAVAPADDEQIDEIADELDEPAAYDGVDGPRCAHGPQRAGLGLP